MDIEKIDFKFDDIMNFIKSERDGLDANISREEEQLIDLKKLDVAIGVCYGLFLDYKSSKKTGLY